MLIRGLQAAPAISKSFSGYTLYSGRENAVALPSGFLGFLNANGNPVFVAPRQGTTAAANVELPGGGYIRRIGPRNYVYANPGGAEVLYEYPPQLDSIMSTSSVFYGGDLKRLRDPEAAPAEFSPWFLSPISEGQSYMDAQTYGTQKTVFVDPDLHPVDRLPPTDYDPPQYDLPGSGVAPPVQTMQPPAPAPAPSGGSGGGASAQANEWYFDPAYEDTSSGGSIGNQTVDVTGAKMSPWPIVAVLALVLIMGGKRKG